MLLLIQVIFIWSEPNLMINKAVMMEYKVITFGVICQKIKLHNGLRFLLTEDQMGLEISKCLLVFQQFSSDLSRTFSRLKSLWHFENSTWNKWKNPIYKMYNILKGAGHCRAKFWASLSKNSISNLGYFSCLILGLVWCHFDALCKMYNLLWLRCSKGNFNQIKLYGKYGNQGEIQLG